MVVGVGGVSVDRVRGHVVCCLSSAAANKIRTNSADTLPLHRGQVIRWEPEVSPAHWAVITK